LTRLTEVPVAMDAAFLADLAGLCDRITEAAYAARDTAYPEQPAHGTAEQHAWYCHGQVGASSIDLARWARAAAQHLPPEASRGLR
jgi:hypothetical protein